MMRRPLEATPRTHGVDHESRSSTTTSRSAAKGYGQHRTKRRARRSLGPVSQRRTVCWLAAVGAMIVTCALGHVWLQLRTLDYGYKLSRAARLHARLAEQNRQLRTELTMLKNPARVAQLGSHEFGLIPPDPAQVHRLVTHQANDVAVARKEGAAARNVDGWRSHAVASHVVEGEPRLAAVGLSAAQNLAYAGGIER